jgi:hypothetical protein
VQEFRMFRYELLSGPQKRRWLRELPPFQVVDELKNGSLLFGGKRIHGVDQVLEGHPEASIV